MRRPARLGCETGYTLPELVTVLAILSIVLTAMLSTFVSGIRAEVDMNERFQAQQEARIAFSKLRREIRCASGATSTGTSVTLALGTYCKMAQGFPAISWCTVSVSTQRFGLYRKPGNTCDASGVKQADYFTSGSVFAVDAVSGRRPRVILSLPVDANPTRSAGRYLLEDAITLRNAPRTP